MKNPRHKPQSIGCKEYYPQHNLQHHPLTRKEKKKKEKLLRIRKIYCQQKETKRDEHNAFEGNLSTPKSNSASSSLLSASQTILKKQKQIFHHHKRNRIKTKHTRHKRKCKILSCFLFFLLGSNIFIRKTLLEQKTRKEESY